MSVLKKKDDKKVDDDKSVKSPIKKVSKKSDSKKNSKTIDSKVSKSSSVDKSKNDKKNTDSNHKSSPKISEKKSSKTVAEVSVEKNVSIKELSPFKLLIKKKEIVKKLRVLVNGVEDKNTFNKVKDLQNKWKEIGQINDAKDKSLWTTYNALLDRFYDNRSIYFELKELDRKKNLELKTQICDKAESLIKDSNVMRSVSKLNELHSEFKHIGPVEKDKQNEIWDRLKNASDEVYKKKKEFISNIKVSLSENLEKKTKLLD